MTAPVDDLPRCPADPAELRELAADVEAASAAYRLATDHLLFTWGLLPGVYRTPEATDLQQTLHVIPPAAAEIDTGLRGARRAIEALADELEAVGLQRDGLVEALSNGDAVELLTFPDADDAFGRRLGEVAQVERDATFRRECARLAEGWDAAARACAAALRVIPEVSSPLARDLIVAEGMLDVPSTSMLDEAALPLLQRLARRDGTDAARLLSENPQWTAIIRRGRPEAVAAWWSRLSPATAAGLVTAVPALVGNLDGVAITDRVAANRMRAAARLAELYRQREDAQLQGLRPLPHSGPDLFATKTQLEAIDREIVYYRAVDAGVKQLYAWDPDHGSLIEMAGDPSTAKAALFVVPGTNTRAESFYGSEPVTRFANWQVNRSRGDAMSFTVMTGEMPQLDSLVTDGPQFNSFAKERAPEYAAFIRGIQAAQPGLWTMSYEHSYAGAIGSAAEAYGGTIDARFMAAAVGAAGPYSPSSETTYYAAQGPDDINRYYAGLGVGYLGFDVAPEKFDGVHIVDTGLPSVDPWKLAVGATPLIVKDSVDHHNALMSDDESINGPVLYAVQNTLWEGTN